MKTLRLPRTAVALVVLVFLAGPAGAQYNVPRYNPGFFPGVVAAPGAFIGSGGTLSGAADLTNAAGNFQIQTEQARIAREQANQAKLDTQRQTFDQMNYERSNTKTRAEEMERITAATVRRMLTEASTPEILTGATLNTLTTFIRRLTDQSVMGPNIPLDPNVVQQLNLAPPGGTVINPGLGMVGDWDNAPWPLSLFEARKKIDPAVREVISQVRMRELNPKTYDQTRKLVRSYLDNLYKLLTPGKVDTGAYLEASTFLTNLDTSLVAIRQPNAYQFFAGDYRAKGNNVLELAMFVTNTGLKFIPARPGQESAYVATHRATVSYIRGAEGTQSFLTRIGDPKQFGKFGGNN
jgi:hypothetical protein